MKDLLNIFISIMVACFLFPLGLGAYYFGYIPVGVLFPFAIGSCASGFYALWYTFVREDKVNE